MVLIKTNAMEGVILAEPVNLENLLNNGTTFSIDAEATGGELLDLYDDDESETETLDKLSCIDSKAYTNLLTTPGSVKFDELSTKMIDCIQNGDVKILILEEGDGPLVPGDALVTLHYSAFWEGDSEPFDCSLEHNEGRPIRKRLGSGNLIPGLEVGLTTVKGPKASFQLLVGPKASWGDLGCMERIRGETALFCVTLLDVQNVGSMEKFSSLPEEEQKKFEINIESALATSDYAKCLFGRKRYSDAVVHYHKTLYILQLCDTKTAKEADVIKQEIKKAYTNIALCYIKKHNAKKALKFLDELGRFTNISTECKPLYLYGRVFFMLGDYEQSLEYYKKSLKLEPKNVEIGQGLAMVEAKIVEGDKKIKEMCANMFKNASIDVSDEIKGENEFENDMIATLRDLAKVDGGMEVPLPAGLTGDEVTFVERVSQKFDRLEFVESERFDGGKSYKIVKRY